MERGEAATAMAIAAANGRPFEDSGVLDTPDNRRIFGRISQEISDMPDGATVDVPFDHVQMPD